MSKKVKIKGKVALVTGANRGIGKAIVEELFEFGASKVYAGARNPASLDGLVAKYGDKLVPLRLDVTNDEDIKNASNKAHDAEILINNAGVLIVGNFTNGNLLQSLEDNMDVNVFGLVKVTDKFLSHLQAKESAAIVNISSVVGLASSPGASTYSASKAAVHSITQGLRGELEDTNILVSTVYPGPIDTDMAKDFDFEKESPEKVATNVLNGIENGDEDIFPDTMSEQVGKGYMNSPKELEKQFANF